MIEWLLSQSVGDSSHRLRPSLIAVKTQLKLVWCVTKKDGRDLAMEVRGEKGQDGPGSGTGLHGVQLQPVARLVSERQRPQDRAGQGSFQQDAGPDEETEGGIQGTYFRLLKLMLTFH